MAWEPLPQFADGTFLTVAQMNRLRDRLSVIEGAVVTAAGQLIVDIGVNTVGILATPTGTQALTWGGGLGWTPITAVRRATLDTSASAEDGYIMTWGAARDLFRPAPGG